MVIESHLACPIEELTQLKSFEGQPKKTLHRTLDVIITFLAITVNQRYDQTAYSTFRVRTNQDSMGYT